MSDSESNSKKSVTIYSAASKLDAPGALLREMAASLGRAGELARMLFRRNLTSRYRESFLGGLWALIPGIVMAAGFTLAERARIVNIADTDLPYPLFVILGTTLWQLFVDMMNAPLVAFNSSKSLLTKINFPREAIFLAQIAEVLFDSVIKFGIVAVLFVFFRQLPNELALLFPLSLIPLAALGLMIGFLLVPFSILMQDAVKMFTLGTGYWFFLTPVVYPVPSDSTLKTLVSINPVTPLIVTARELLSSTTLTYAEQFWYVAPIAVLGLFFSWLLVYLALPMLIERISS